MAAPYLRGKTMNAPTELDTLTACLAQAESIADFRLKEMARFLAQRDELLAALEGFMWLADDYAHGANDASRKVAASLIQARAAIAAARGQ